MRRLLAAAILLASPALAADAPPIIPTRDVDIRYQVGAPPGSPPLEQRMRWSVALGKLRVDPPTPGLYMIVDYRSHQMEVVKPVSRAVLDMTTAGPSLPGDPAGQYTRLGPDQVAGLSCTDWQTTDANGRPTVLCLTADGVMLRASQGDQVLVEAVSVAYGPQDAAVFAVPDGYTRIAAASNPGAKPEGAR